MVLALNTIWNEGPFSIRVENHRDRYCASIPPTESEKYIGARWIDKGPARTVLTLVHLDPDERDAQANSDSCTDWVIPPDSKTAVISLEDINWQLVIKGDVKGGEVHIPVNGNKDFDIVVRKDGSLAIRCLGGAFVDGMVQHVVFIPAFAALPAHSPSFTPSTRQHVNAVASSSKHPQPPASLDAPSTSTSTPPSTERRVQTSYSLSDISPELLTLLDELRADQRRILQKEFQLVGAGFAEKLDWLMIGGRRLMNAADPSEYLPMAALINLLVIPLIFLFSYCYAARRRSISSGPRAGPPRRRSLPIGSSSSMLSRRRIMARGDVAPPPGTLLARYAGRNDDRDDDQEEDEAPPPYPEEEGRALF